MCYIMYPCTYMLTCLPVAVSSVIVTSIITSSDATSLIVIVTDNEPFSLGTKYSDCSKDITASIYKLILVYLNY